MQLIDLVLIVNYLKICFVAKECTGILLFRSYRNLNLQFLNINDDEINMSDYEINYLTLILMFLLILMLLNIPIGINIIRIIL